VTSELKGDDDGGGADRARAMTGSALGACQGKVWARFCEGYGI